VDELNLIYERVAGELDPSQDKALRGALGLACSALLDIIVNPVLARFPQLELEDAEWEDVALKHRR
jgi:hypothetical protein